MEILTGGRSIAKQKFFELEQKNIELQNEKQQLIKFLEDKIKECMDKKEAFIEGLDNWDLEIDIMKVLNQRKVYQEVLDFVNKGGKDE